MLLNDPRVPSSGLRAPFGVSRVQSIESWRSSPSGMMEVFRAPPAFIDSKESLCRSMGCMAVARLSFCRLPKRVWVSLRLSPPDPSMFKFITWLPEAPGALPRFVDDWVRTSSPKRPMSGGRGLLRLVLDADWTSRRRRLSDLPTCTLAPLPVEL